MQKSSKSCETDSFFQQAMSIIDTNFQDCPDLVKRHVSIHKCDTGCFVYLKDIVNENGLQQNFIQPILSLDCQSILDERRIEKLPSSNLSIISDLNALTSELLRGSAVFIMESSAFAAIYSSPKKIERALKEPETEKNIKGAHDGFIENIDTNLGILRRKVKNQKLKFKQFSVGTESNLSLYIAYLDGLADLNILAELTRKISGVNLKNVPAMGYIARIISSHPNSPFQQVQLTERPDKAVAALMEGRFVIMLDGVPNVLIAPITFLSFFQTLDDYGRSWFLGTFLRLIRYAAMLITIFLPSIYLAFTGFHYYVIPVNLIITLAESRAKVPFPPFVEILIMEFAIEALREATIRLPTYIGMTIGVVGGIVIGQAAVEAGIISNLLLIVIGFSTICASTLPAYDHALGIRYSRFVCLLFTAFFGIIGIAVFLMVFFAHLVSLDSLGQPYLKQQNPFKLKSP
jgi:spore germination protein